jgi:hypothetical protein
MEPDKVTATINAARDRSGLPPLLGMVELFVGTTGRDLFWHGTAQVYDRKPWPTSKQAPSG